MTTPLYFGNYSERMRLHRQAYANARLSTMQKLSGASPNDFSTALGLVEGNFKRGAIALIREWKQHYGYDNKYSGDGRLRLDSEVMALMLSVKRPGDWMEL